MSYYGTSGYDSMGGKRKGRGRARSKPRAASRSASRSVSKSRSRSRSKSGGKPKKLKEEKVYALIQGGRETVVTLVARSAAEAARKFASKQLRKEKKRKGSVTVHFRCLSSGKTQNYTYGYELSKILVKSDAKVGKKKIADKNGMVSKFSEIKKISKVRPSDK